MQRLGKNLGGYRGEPIKVEKILTEIANAADRTGWHRDFFSAAEGDHLLAYRRQAIAPRARLYISTGIHGDEPAGPVAVSELLRQNDWPDTVDIWLCPCLNPSGFALNTRENARGIDLNRDYRHLSTPEIRSHVAWLGRQPQFDLTLCLHEDWEAGGFYVYELNPDGQPSCAREIIKKVAEVCPIETGAQVDGWEIKAGIIRPQTDPLQRPQWPEAIFLIQNKTRLGYTLEAPSDFPLPIRVAALITGVRTVLELLASGTNRSAQSDKGSELDDSSRRQLK